MSLKFRFSHKIFADITEFADHCIKLKHVNSNLCQIGTTTIIVLPSVEWNGVIVE